jgi:hypothetical protein
MYRVLVALLATLATPALAQAQGATADRPMMTPPPFESTRIGVTVFPGLTSNAGLPDDLRFGRLALQAGNVVSPDMLRDLADRRDGLAAQRYVDWLLTEAPAPPPSDIATYAAIAAGTGRTNYLAEFIAALYALDPATEPEDRVSLYISVLYPHAWAGNLLALDAVIDHNGPGRLFGDLSDATRTRILDMDSAEGNGRAALRLALGLMLQQPRSASDDAQIDAYLARAMSGNNLGIRVTAANLLAARSPAAVDGVLVQ